MKTVFLFDLDGTLTREETLPRIARHFGIAGIDELTARTVAGEAPFDASLDARIRALGHLPVERVRALLEGTPLHEGLSAFIRAHSESCAIVTGNIRPWVEPLAARIGCTLYASEAEMRGGMLRLTARIDKAAVVRRRQSAGARVVFIGDGDNDVTAMEAADSAVASALTHRPAEACVRAADYVATDEQELIDYFIKIQTQGIPSHERGT